MECQAEEYRKPPYGKEVDGTVELLEEAAECIDRLVDAKNRDEVYRRCISEYGGHSQVDMIIEEMSELTKALLKYRRKYALANGEKVTPVSGDLDLNKARMDIIDELADVRIMCRIMEILYQAEDEVERRIDFKVDRQIRRFGGDEKKIVNKKNAPN